MLALAPNAYWPCCGICRGNIWKFHRSPEGGGLETQSFTCSKCDHVTVLFVTVLPALPARDRDVGEGVPLNVLDVAAWCETGLVA